jgi:polysaccharide export outer membrane protein
LVEASIEPVAGVSNAQVFFRASRADVFHGVQMVLTQDRFRAKLPKPKQKAGTVLYYIVATDTAGGVQRTPEMSSEVVKKREACSEGAFVAAEGSGDDVRVYATTNSTRKPDEFSGVEGVMPMLATPEGAVEPAAPTAPPGVAPQPAPAAPAAAAPPADAGVVHPPSTEEFEYQIGPNDILKISVYGYEEASQTVLVQDDGTFMYPLIGRVKASEMTTKELERKIATLLGKGYIRNPQVTVNVQEARSRSVYVLGEVARAGRYSLVDAKTILDLAARAGISNTADIQIVRPRGDVQGPQVPPQVAPTDGEGAPVATGQTDIIRVSMRDIQAGDLRQNIALRPNDTVFIVPGKRVYVLGEVRSPGPFAPPPGATVEQMILSAGGFTDRASKGNIRITRRDESGEKKEYKAKPEDTVLPGDIITVKAKLF